MANFAPNGRAHRILECLVEGDAGFTHLFGLVGQEDGGKERKRLCHVVGSLLAAELIGGRRQRYYLRHEGRQALEALRADQSVTIEDAPQTSIRRFA